MLVQFKLTQSIQLEKEEATNLLKFLFHDQLMEFAQRNNPFVDTKPFIELYTSSEVGRGKSYLIQKRAKQVNAEIDLDFLVSRLWSFSSFTDNLQNDIENAEIESALSEKEEKAQQPIENEDEFLDEALPNKGGGKLSIENEFENYGKIIYNG